MSIIDLDEKISDEFLNEDIYAVLVCCIPCVEIGVPSK
jgi:hypothetical protein